MQDGLPWLAASYVLGSIPFGWIVAKLVKGVDLRTAGSGNVGATNAARVLGGRWFPVVFVLDAAKGALPVLWLAPQAGYAPPADARFAMACGLTAILGHVFPVWLRFRGGKGVATGAGVIGALAPLPAAAALGAFVLTLIPYRYVSLASVVACGVLPFVAWAMGTPVEITVFCAVVGALVIVLHRKNLVRIRAGTEPRVFQKKAVEAPHA